MNRSVLLIALSVTAVLPLVPSFRYFTGHRSVPASVKADAAFTELAVREASHFQRLLGPASRWRWNHPGPALFYALAPAYQLGGQQNCALGWGSLVLNTLCLVGIVRLSARLGGLAQAATVAVLAGVYLTALHPTNAASDWGPYVTILPFVLLMHLSAVLAVEGWRWLPAYVALGSAIVQTHIAYVPPFALLLAMGVAAQWLRRVLPARRDLLVAGAAALLLWLPPLLAEARPGPGNVARLVRFFAHERTPHRLAEVLEPITAGVAFLPVEATRLLSGRPSQPHPVADRVVAALLLSTLAALCWRVKASGTRFLSLAPLLTTLVATWSLFRIVGDIHHYLTLWTTAISFVACSAVVGAIVREWGGRPRAAIGMGLVAAGLVGWSVVVNLRQVGAWPPVATQPLPEVAGVADAVERWAREGRKKPLIQLAVADAWPDTAGVVLELVKRGVPVAVHEDWLWMYGERFATTGPATTLLLLGDASSEAELRARPDLTPVATGGPTIACALERPRWLAAHTLRQGLRLVSATGDRTDPGLAVDGIVPPDGVGWEDPRSFRMEGPGCTLTLEVLATSVGGLVLQAEIHKPVQIDSSQDGRAWTRLAEALPNREPGLRHRLVMLTALDGARFVRLRAEHAGGYAIGEVRALAR